MREHRLHQPRQLRPGAPDAEGGRQDEALGVVRGHDRRRVAHAVSDEVGRGRRFGEGAVGGSGRGEGDDDGVDWSSGGGKKGSLDVCPVERAALDDVQPVPRFDGGHLSDEGGDGVATAQGLVDGQASRAAACSKDEKVHRECRQIIFSTELSFSPKADVAIKMATHEGDTVPALRCRGTDRM